MTAIGIDCRLEMARLRGNDLEGVKQYEIACVDAPGYLLVGGRTPVAYPCLGLEAVFRLTGQEASRCSIRANRDPRPVVRELAAQVGIPCQIDDAFVVGQSAGGELLYEVGCAGTDGFWLEHLNNAWTATPCLKVVVQGGECRLTTPAEQAATLGRRLTGVSDCEVVEAVFRGSGDGSDLYEARCRSGAGLLARLDRSDKIVEIFPCAEATHIGGGCRLGRN